MEKKFVIKDFILQRYYAGDIDNIWSTESYLSMYFDSIEKAEKLIKRLKGKFQIEKVYIINKQEI